MFEEFVEFISNDQFYEFYSFWLIQSEMILKFEVKNLIVA